MDFSLLFAQIKIVMPFAQTHSKKLYRGSPRFWLTPPQKKSPGGISEAMRYGIEAFRSRHQARFTIARRRCRNALNQYKNHKFLILQSISRNSFFYCHYMINSLVASFLANYIRLLLLDSLVIHSCFLHSQYILDIIS